MVLSNVICCSGLGLNTITSYISDEKQNFPETNRLLMHRYEKDTVKGFGIFCLEKRGSGGVSRRKEEFW